MKVIKKSEEVDINRVVNWDKNPRAIDKKEYELLKKHIRQLGVYKPLIAYEENNKYICLGGNMRLRALRELGYKKVWITVIEPENEKEKIEISLSDNQRFGYYQEDELAELIYDFKDEINLEDFKVDLSVPSVGVDDILKYVEGDDMCIISGDNLDRTMYGISVGDKVVVIIRDVYGRVDAGKVGCIIERIRSKKDRNVNEIFEEMFDFLIEKWI